MFLNFLGRGSAFNTKEGNTSAYFIDDEVLYLIDCGETVYSRINQVNLLRGIKEVKVLITHLHSDHVGSLSTLIHDCFHRRHIPVTVITPCEKIKELLKIQDVKDLQCTINILRPNIFYPIKDNSDDINVKFIEVNHIYNMKTYGILIDVNGIAIWYSSDTNEINEKYFNLFLNKNVDEFYQDVCSTDYTGNVHTYYGKIIKLIQKTINEYSANFDYHYNIDSVLNNFYTMHIDDNSLIKKLDCHSIKVVDNIESLRSPKTKKDKLIDLCDEALEKKDGMFTIMGISDNNKDNEIILNTSSNVETKKRHYNDLYTDNLRLINNNDIRIVDFGIITDCVINGLHKREN